MAEIPKSAEHQAVVREIQRLLALAEAGELPSLALVLVQADGTRREYVLGTMADLPPAELESIREVLGELADGDTPGAGHPKQ